MLKLEVNEGNAIKLLKKIAELWDKLPWNEQYKKMEDQGEDDEECRWYELICIHHNMDKIERIFMELYGKNYVRDIN